MAIVLKFRRDATDLNLQAGDAGLQLRPGWRPKIARISANGSPETAEEVLPIRITGTSHDNLAAHLQALHQMQAWAVGYIGDRTVEHPVWLHARLNNETGERRALVREMGPEPESGWFDALSIGNKAEVALPVMRAGGWERKTRRRFPQAAPAAAAAIVYDYTAAGAAVGAHDTVGDVPARIGLFNMYSPSGGSNIGRVWIGLRSNDKHPTLSNYVPIWELESGQLHTDAALATDATASPGGAGNTKVVVTPGTATWAKRVSIQLQDICSNNEKDHFGLYLWLLRGKVSAGVWEVQLRWGCHGMDDADFIEGAKVELSSSSWDETEMGQSRIPIRDLHNIPLSIMPDSRDHSYEIQVWARRTSGSGVLNLDCLPPIPVDEGWFKAWDFDLSAGDWDNLYFSESPEEHQICLTYNTTALAFDDFPPFEAHNFRLPPGDGRMIVVYAGPTASVLSDQVCFHHSDTASSYFERWLSLRGAE